MTDSSALSDEETPLSDFIQLLNRPEESLVDFLFPKNGASSSAPEQDTLRTACQHLFQQVERLYCIQQSLTSSRQEPSSLSGLDDLYLGENGEGAIDVETLFGQVELQNHALQRLLKKNVRRVVKAAEQDEVTLLDMGGVNEESAEESEPDDEVDEDEETRRIRERMEKAVDDMDSDLNSEEDEEMDEKRRAKRTSAEEDDVDEEVKSLEDPAAEELNDGFFDIHEMEAFADEEEEYLPDEAFGTVKPEEHDNSPKKSFHQRQREGDIDSGSDDEEDALAFRQEETTISRRKYREDDEIEALYGLYDKVLDDDDSVAQMTAAELYGKPNTKYFDSWNKKQEGQSRGKQSSNPDIDDTDSWDNHDFEEEAGHWRDTVRDGELEEHAGDQDESDAESVDEGEDKRSEPVNKKTDDKLARQTEELEKEMLAEKPWHMIGEAKSSARPVNSLLDATPEFEVATKMAPIITVEHTASIEDIIKKRIISEDWDDVVPRELPDVGWHKQRGELPEVSQEKSKLGLGELYEREYLKKAVGYDVDAVEKETEEEKAKNEMKALFTSLCSKLDALSNYHFAPRPVADEADVRPVTIPAIAMEEIMPLHVSDARGVAPEEVYVAKKGRDSVLRGETEMDQSERKRLRRAKKAARRKARKAKLADEKLISRLQPGLGLNNPYEKRKMREELQMARSRGKVTTGEKDSNADYGASGKFFKRMQDEVEQAIKGDDDGRKRQKRDDGTSGRKSSAFKL